jgi:hypothetical protein
MKLGSETVYSNRHTVKSWLDANPNEGKTVPESCRLRVNITSVLSLLIVNSDNFLPTAYDAVFKGAGLDTMSYAPPSASIPATQWPTLGSLIDSGKRLITFMDASADFNSVSYIIDGACSTLHVPPYVPTLSHQNLQTYGNHLMTSRLPLTAALIVHKAIHRHKCTSSTTSLTHWFLGCQFPTPAKLIKPMPYLGRTRSANRSAFASVNTAETPTLCSLM